MNMPTPENPFYFLAVNGNKQYWWNGPMISQTASRVEGKPPEGDVLAFLDTVDVNTYPKDGPVITVTLLDMPAPKEGQHTATWGQAMYKLIPAEDFSVIKADLITADDRIKDKAPKTFITGISAQQYLLLSLQEGAAGRTHLHLLAQHPYPTAHIAREGYDWYQAQIQMLHGPHKISDDNLEQALETYCWDITDRVAEGSLGPAMGREAEVDAVIEALSKRQNASVCLVGESGAGKTATAYVLAQRILDGQVPEFLKDARILRLDMAALTAGTQIIGTLEERMKTIIDGLTEREGVFQGQRIIFDIDQIHEHLAISDSVSKSAAEGAQLLRPFISARGISVMGETTPEQYRKIAKDKQLKNILTPVRIRPESDDNTLTILKGAYLLEQEHHGLEGEMAEDDLRSIIALTKTYLPVSAQPGASVNALSRIAARAVAAGRKAILPEDIVDAIASMAGLPKDHLTAQGRKKLLGLPQYLSEHVYDQPCVAAIGRKIAASYAGLREPNRPRGFFVVVGPTGTGKTELAKQIAIFTHGKADENTFLKVDMGEYANAADRWRLTGSAAGYIGSDREGVLTGFVRKNPYSVVLLDEIEKCDPKILDMLLGICNDGYNTDNQGERIDYKNVVFIATSNAGADEVQALLKRYESTGSTQVGFGSPAAAGASSALEEKADNVSRNALKKFLKPEAIGRIDSLGGVYCFKSLTQNTMRKLVERETRRIQDRLNADGAGNRAGLTLEIGADLKEQLAKKGYDPVYGARPLEKVVQDKLGDPLSLWILENEEEVQSFLATHGGKGTMAIESIDFKSDTGENLKIALKPTAVGENVKPAGTILTHPFNASIESGKKSLLPPTGGAVTVRERNNTSNLG